MPRGQGPTPRQAFRVDPDLWEEFGRVVGPRNRTREIVTYIEHRVGRGVKLPKPAKRPKPGAAPAAPDQ